VVKPASKMIWRRPNWPVPARARRLARPSTHLFGSVDASKPCSSGVGVTPRRDICRMNAFAID
jgi:hypothetical protein